jgi:hypothetical protein
VFRYKNGKHYCVEVINGNLIQHTRFFALRQIFDKAQDFCEHPFAAFGFGVLDTSPSSAHGLIVILIIP